MNPGRAVVIGSGLAGTSTALLLAEGGWEVDILEAHSIPGGLMQRYRRGDCRFDTGFHLLSGAQPGGTLRSILGRLGTLEDTILIAPDPAAQFTIHMPGVTPFTVPPGIAAVEAAACARWPHDAPGIAEFFRLLRGRLAANPYLQNLAPGAAVESLPAAISVAAVLQRCGLSPQAQDMLGAASAILAMRPERCPFDLFTAFAGSSFAAAWRCADGGDGLMGPLLRRAQGLGARLHLRRPAQQIEHDGRHATAVIDQRGQRYPCDMVVAAIHPAHTLRLTGPDGFRPTFKARMEEIPDSFGALLLAARLEVPATALGRRHHLLRLEDGSDCYLVAPDQWQGGPPCLEAMVWIDTARTAAFADDKLGQRSAQYEAWKQQQETQLRAAIDAHFPGLCSTITRSWTASPLTFRDYLGGRDGGAMGLSHDLDGGLGDGPIGPRNKLRNLILSGHSIHHPGILGSLIGGCVTAGSILGIDIHQEIFA